MSGSSRIRTDLALEATESFAQSNTELRGVEVKEQYDEERDIRTTVVKITTENGAKAMGRPQGNYITIEAPNLSASDEDYHREISEEIARHLRKLVNLKRETSVLVVGLGNQAITADALGPHVVDNHRSQNQADCKRNQNRYYNLIIHPHTSYHSFVFIS